MLRSCKLWLLALSFGVVNFAAPVRAAEIDKLTPADAQAVMVFNVRQSLESPLAKKKGVTDMVKSQIDSNPQAKQAFAALGLDLTKDIETVSIAVGNFNDLQGGKPEKMLVTIRGNFDPDKLEAAAKKADTVKIMKEGNVTVYEIKEKGGDAGYATLIGKTTIAAAPSKDYLLNAVKNIGGGSKELVKAGTKVDGKQSMWLAVVVSDDMKKQMAANPQFKAIAEKLESITAGVSVTDAIVLDVNVNTTDGEAAKAMKVQVDAALPFLKALAGDEKAGPVINDVLNGLKVSANATAMNINLKVTEETLDKIIKLAQMK